MTISTSVTQLTNPDARDASRFGGKAAGLALLKQTKIDVPDGFIVPPETDPSHNNSLSHAYNALAGHERFPFPVAVRSSAVGEDSAMTSYAGQHDTVLNVGTRYGLSQAIQRVRDSADSARAREYRRANNIPEKPRVPVVVQRMVDLKWMVIVFSQNPVMPEANQFVVEYKDIPPSETADTVVSGEVTPSTLMISRNHPLSLLKVDFFESPNQLSPRLEPGRVTEILEMAVKIEQLIGHPVDIECGIDRQGQLWALQARPISTIPPVVDRERVVEVEPAMLSRDL